MTSGYDESLCQHAVPAAGPKDWVGGEIKLIHGFDVVTLPTGFKNFEHCIDNVDESLIGGGLIFLESTSDDGTCITGLFSNGNQLLAGKNNDLQSFWIDGNDPYCLDNFMSTHQIAIKNGRVVHSTSCMGYSYG